MSAYTPTPSILANEAINQLVQQQQNQQQNTEAQQTQQQGFENLQQQQAQETTAGLYAALNAVRVAQGQTQGRASTILTRNSGGANLALLGGT